MAKTTLIALTLLLLSVALPASPQDAQLETSGSVAINPDSHEYYLLQAFNATTSQQRLPLNHIGLLTLEVNDGYIVSGVLDGYPAHLAGLRAGDRMTTVNGETFHPIWSFNSREQAPAGLIADKTEYQIKFTRNGDDQAVTLTPVFENLYDAYRTATLSSRQEFSSGNKIIGYIKLWSLSRSTGDLVTFRRLVESLSHCDGLIIDIRDSYGFVTAAHLDQFFPSRNSYFEFNNINEETWNSRQALGQFDDYYGNPMVIIQNRETRGGMELFSYQLSKLQRVITLGTESAGKLGAIAGDSSSQLSYHANPDATVDGLILENTGSSPEQTVPYSLDESTATDPFFEAAILTLMAII